MSFLVAAYLLDRYGPRLNVEEIAEVLGFSPPTIYNRISKGTLGIPTYVDGGRRFADYRDVMEYLDRCRPSGQAQL